ncbi:MAG: hypothetical protein JSR20_17845 [Nitrospira sp.]|jgi:hypothetical protein|nr:hypothetical protein [Nitrospira sp.]MBS0180619.1 hypothetical protein [Nitrospira sp.]MBX3320591.1 hypothetical protein [Nitrospira sp.]MCC7470584.1 hypothetical protein [Candidatus Nomurabacteria bacterium]MDR4481473.1 hypothetical protein [Nitrospira sp.]
MIDEEIQPWGNHRLASHRLARQLAQLDLANTVADMNVTGWGLHALAGRLVGHYSGFRS